MTLPTLIEQNDEWAVGRRYFSLKSMALLNAPEPLGTLADKSPPEAAAE